MKNSLIYFVTVLLLGTTYLSQASSVNGKTLSDKKIVLKDGYELHLARTKSKSPRGTILLLPGGDYNTINTKSEGLETAKFFNPEGFDVAILSYHIAEGSHTREIALPDALKAFRFITAKHDSLKINGDRFIIMGFSAGGNLAARAVQNLGRNEQPDDLILVTPSNMSETLPGTVYYSVMPPSNPSARLLLTISDKEDKVLISRCEQYAKTWTGYDGAAEFVLSADSSYIPEKNINPMDKNFNLSRIIISFLNSDISVKANNENPAAVPVEGYSPKRHAQKLEAVSKEKFDLIFIGNSITNNFEKPEYQPIWNQFFAPRHALNLGYSGYRTENIIWNIQNGELEGQSPKVIILEIGTNNIDEKHYKTRHTASELAGGIEEIVKQLRVMLPETKIIVMRCFPGSYDGQFPTSHRAILDRASEIVSGLDDGKHVFFCDVNQVFLNADGSLNHDMMPDWLHPSPQGAIAWALAMEPLLSKLMGDKSPDTDIPQ